MKKRIFSRLMAMFMAVALLSTTAFAYVAIDGNYINELNKNPQTDANGNQFVSVPQGDDGDNEYRLVDNVETDYTLKFSGDREVTLDLNGHTIDHQNKAGSVIWVDDGAKLTLEDSSGKENGEYVNAGEGKITGGTGGGVYLNKGEFIMNAGTITENTSYSHAGVSLYGDDSSFEMYGGAIENNHCKSFGGGRAGAIYSQGSNSSVKIYGGSIANNNGAADSPATSAIMMTSGTLEIHGGTISGNKANGGKSACIRVGNGVTVRISGGKIIDNDGSLSDYSNAKITGGIICGNGDGKHPSHTYSPATCTEPETCTYCGITRGKPLNHTWTEVPSQQPTCTEPGHEAGRVCTSGCQEGLEVIPATGHTSGTPVRENEVAASAGVTGSYDEVVYCTECGEELSRVTRTIPALPMPVDFGDGTGTGAGTGGTTIDDEATPLAGILTLADLLNALYEHEGIEAVELPGDFQWADHVYAQAIHWGLSENLVVDTEDDPLDPDEAVTVALLREVLTGYVAYKSIDFTVVVDGADEDLVLDLGERLTVFFAQLKK